MLHARGALGSDFELVVCQLLQGCGGGIAQVIITLSAQASVTHKDVAAVIALVSLLSESILCLCLFSLISARFVLGLEAYVTTWFCS